MRRHEKEIWKPEWQQISISFNILSTIIINSIFFLQKTYIFAKSNKVFSALNVFVRKKCVIQYSRYVYICRLHKKIASFFSYIHTILKLKLNTINKETDVDVRMCNGSKILSMNLNYVYYDSKTKCRKTKCRKHKRPKKNGLK